MKTLQECKDEVARRHGFKSWEDARETWIKRTGVARVTHESYIEEVATLYAQSLCKEQREICAREIWPDMLNDSTEAAVLNEAQESNQERP